MVAMGRLKRSEEECGMSEKGDAIYSAIFFAFLEKCREKTGVTSMQNTLLLSFACLQEFCFFSRSKGDKESIESSSFCRLFLLMLAAGGVYGGTPPHAI
jgi:hypothetical protein